jgi:hypothetical protein
MSRTFEDSLRHPACKGSEKKGGTCPCIQCTATTVKGKQCTRRTCLGPTTLCWTHQQSNVYSIVDVVPAELLAKYQIKASLARMGASPFLLLDGMSNGHKVTVKVFTSKESTFFEELYWNTLMPASSARVLGHHAQPVEHIVFERLLPINEGVRKTPEFLESFRSIVREMVEKQSFFENLDFHNLMQTESGAVVVVGWHQVSPEWSTVKNSLINCGLCQHQEAVTKLLAKEPTGTKQLAKEPTEKKLVVEQARSNVFQNHRHS